MIKSWIDAEGVRQYADEHSKAYRNRTLSETDSKVEAGEQTVEDTVDKGDTKSRRPIVKTPEAPAS